MTSHRFKVIEFEDFEEELREMSTLSFKNGLSIDDHIEVTFMKKCETSDRPLFFASVFLDPEEQRDLVKFIIDNLADGVINHECD